MSHKKLNLLFYTSMVITLTSFVDASDRHFAEDADSSHNLKRTLDAPEDSSNPSKRFKADNSVTRNFEDLLTELRKVSGEHRDFGQYPHYKEFADKAKNILDNPCYNNLGDDTKDLALAAFLCRRNDSDEAKHIFEKFRSKPSPQESIEQFYKLARVLVFGTGSGGADHLSAYRFFQKVAENKDLVSAETYNESLLRIGYIWERSDNYMGGVNHAKSDEYSLKVLEHPDATPRQRQTAYHKLIDHRLIYNDFDKAEKYIESFSKVSPNDEIIRKLKFDVNFKKEREMKKS